VTDINIDDFCKDTGRALLVLYRSFPRPVTLFVEDLCGPDQPDEFGVHSERHLACFSTLLWLAEEGFLRFVDTIRQQAVDQAVLTGRSLMLLSTPAPGFEHAHAAGSPESLRLEQQTHVHRLERALAARSSTRIRSAVLDLITAFVGAPPVGAIS
jgi:hypothetical protein